VRLQTDTKKISAVSIYFETMPDRLNEETGYIDYDTVSNLSFPVGAGTHGEKEQVKGAGRPKLSL